MISYIVLIFLKLESCEASKKSNCFFKLAANGTAWRCGGI